MAHISLIILFCLSGLSAAATVIYTVPSTVPNLSGVIAPAPIGVSFEFGAFPSYFTELEAVTNQCLQNLEILTGKWPPVRIGGASQDRAAYNASSPSYIAPSVPMPTGVAAKLQFGPSFMTLASTYMGNVILGLNRGLADLSNTLDAAKVAKQRMSNLQAIELGNEPDCKPPTPSEIIVRAKEPVAIAQGSWTPAIDAASENDWDTRICEALSTQKLIQAGNFAYQPSVWGAAELIRAENKTVQSYINTYSHHNYPGGPLNSLMSHHKIVENIAKHATDCAAAISVGKDYVLGETNSVAGGGTATVSPTFGAALWTIDYALHAVSSNIKRIYFHHGTVDSPCHYCWWTAHDIRNPYYGAYVATAAMAGGQHIAALDSETSQSDVTAVYVIYSETALLRALLYNSKYYDGNGTRDATTFLLTGLTVLKLKAKRLTAGSALSTRSNGEIPSFGGQNFQDSTCSITGEETFEYTTVVNGQAKFTISASEALLVYFTS